MVCTICNSVISVIFKAFCTKLLEWFKNKFIAVVDKFHCAACFIYIYYFILYFILYLYSFCYYFLGFLQFFCFVLLLFRNRSNLKLVAALKAEFNEESAVQCSR